MSTLFILLIACVVAFLAFRFIMGMVKFGVVALVVVVAVWFIRGGGHI
jgi:hypothetical protein